MCWNIRKEKFPRMAGSRNVISLETLGGRAVEGPESETHTEEKGQEGERADV